MAKKKYTLVCNMRHDGKRYKAGEVIELDEKDAKDLLKRGSLKVGNKEVEMTSPLEEPAKGETGKDQPEAERITADAAANPLPTEE